MVHRRLASFLLCAAGTVVVACSSETGDLFPDTGGQGGAGSTTSGSTTTGTTSGATTGTTSSGTTTTGNTSSTGSETSSTGSETTSTGSETTTTSTGEGGGSTGQGGAGVTSVTATSTGAGGGLVGEGDLVISEIMNNPAEVSDANGEWFEVHNPTAFAIDMAGLRIVHDDVAPPHVIASALIVPAGGYAVLGINGDAGTNGGVTVDYVVTDVFLGNNIDVLAIETDLGQVIDFTSWDQASGLDPDGASRSLDPASLAAATNDDDTNWCEATSFISGGAGDTGTPGAANDVCACPYTNDGECDEPEGTSLCPEGTDVVDCACPYTNDGECDEPEGTNLCPEGTDVNDCL